MIVYLNFTVIFLMTSVFEKLLFSGLLMGGKKNGTKKVGHIYKFISCTGLDYTGRSLFSIALDNIIMDL